LRAASGAFDVCFDLQKNLSGRCAVPKIAWMDFAASESLAVDILPEIMQRLRAKLPDIRLKVKSGRSTDLTKCVNKGELCMAVVEENEFIDLSCATVLAEDRLGFYCSSQVTRPDRGTLDRLGVGVLTAGHDGHASYFTRFMRPLGKGFKPTLTSESYEILRASAVAGSVVAVLPKRVAGRRVGELTEIQLDSEKPLGAYKIYLVSERGCSPEENDFLAAELKSLISG
jgi:DNA-binding transcriptional LysR family regulator